MDHESWLGGLTAGGIVALLGAAFPYAREWWQNRSKSTEAKTTVDAKNVDVSAIVAQQMQHFTDQMMSRISTLENNERGLRLEMHQREALRSSQIEELERENEECRASNGRLSTKVDIITREVNSLRRENATLKSDLANVKNENKRLREWGLKNQEELRKVQKHLDFTPLELPHEPARAEHFVETPFKKDDDDGK